MKLSATVAVVGATLGALAISPPAIADTVDAMVGNTILEMTPDGAVTRFKARADNTFTVEAPNGVVIKGAWRRAGAQLCMSQTDPAPAPGAPPESCIPIDDHKLGESWTMKGADGSEIKLSIVPGQ